MDTHSDLLLSPAPAQGRALHIYFFSSIFFQPAQTDSPVASLSINTLSPFLTSDADVEFVFV
jgi:hypothetical protein